MRSTFTRVLLMVVVFGVYAGWSLRAQESPPTKPVDKNTVKPVADGPVLNKAFIEKVLAAATGYEKFAQVDDKINWAPILCAAAPPPGGLKPDEKGTARPSGALFSKSEDAGTHGQKLYVLFAQDRKQYASLRGKFNFERRPAEPGQVIVKESWVPEKVAVDAAAAKVVSKPGEPPTPAAINPLFTKDAKGDLYRCKEKSAIFIMLKLDPGTPDTDNGWVYGTVTADGKSVTSAGRVQSCMECHLMAPHDRLFGPVRAAE